LVSLGVIVLQRSSNTPLEREVHAWVSLYCKQLNGSADRCLPAARDTQPLAETAGSRKIQRYGGFMKGRFLASLAVLAFFFSAAAQAQERQVIDVGVSYSYVRYNPATTGFNSQSMNGGSGSVAVNFNSWLSGVADLGGYARYSPAAGSGSSVLSTYLFGPRISLNRSGRVTPFAQVLVGVAHAGSNYFTTGGSQTPFAAAIGGGLDWHFTRHLRIRAAEVDYLLTHFSEVTNINTQVQNNLRVSTGLVFRF
jgi:hypothetical protein